ncbi:phosphate transport system ATP-binding protein [Desulfitispora alkaliphila]
MTSKDVIFNVDKLNLWYGTNQALKDICFKIEANKVTSIIGPSGCGKSTFLKVLNRMIDIVPDVKIDGKIEFKGKNIFSDKINLIDYRTNVGMVFQKPNPFPKSIFENVVYAPKIHGIKDKKKLGEIAERSLKQAALWDEVKDRLHESGMSLSGGQQQRLCIARALAMEPEVILMDEPTSALDPISTLKVEELIRELQEKYHIIIVTHNMQQAARVSDSTAFFLNGELVEIGETETIFTKPANQKTEDYITGRFG